MKGGIAVGARGERAGALALALVAVAPALAAQALAEGGGVFRAERRERFEDDVDGLVEGGVHFEIGDHRDVGVVLVDLVELQHAAAQLEVPEQRREVRADGGDEIVVDGGRDIVAKERGFARGGVIAGAGGEDIGADGMGERRGERVGVVAEFGVKLVEGGFADWRDRA